MKDLLISLFSFAVGLACFLGIVGILFGTWILGILGVAIQEIALPVSVTLALLFTLFFISAYLFKNAWN